MEEIEGALRFQRVAQSLSITVILPVRFLVFVFPEQVGKRNYCYKSVEIQGDKYAYNFLLWQGVRGRIVVRNGEQQASVTIRMNEGRVVVEDAQGLQLIVEREEQA